VRLDARLRGHDEVRLDVRIRRHDEVRLTLQITFVAPAHAGAHPFATDFEAGPGCPPARESRSARQRYGYVS
jgi:hypothetical protein